jgi:hypothetical protein
MNLSCIIYKNEVPISWETNIFSIIESIWLIPFREICLIADTSENLKRHIIVSIEKIQRDDEY